MVVRGDRHGRRSRQPRIDKPDAEAALEAMMTRERALGKRSAPPGAAAHDISDAEFNAYFDDKDNVPIPACFADRALNALGEGKVTAKATVDLDAVRKQKQRGMARSDESAHRARCPLTLNGALAGSGGVGHVRRSQSAAVSAPGRCREAVLQELIAYYSALRGLPCGHHARRALRAAEHRGSVDAPLLIARGTAARPVVRAEPAGASRIELSAQDYLSTPLQFLSKVWGPRAPPTWRAPASRRSKTCCCVFRCATKIARRPANIRTSQARRDGRRRPPKLSRAGSARRVGPGFRLFECDRA